MANVYRLGRYLVLISAALVAANAVAQLPRDTKVLSCAGPLYRSFLETPVTDVRRDIGVVLYAVDGFHELSRTTDACEERYNLKPLLLRYLENRWIAETLGEPLEPVATVGDALRQQVARQQQLEAQNAFQVQDALEARRLSAYRRSLLIRVPDEIPSPNEVTIDVRNVSSWTMRLYPHNVAGGRWPTLEFRATPESDPIPFDCRYIEYVTELASGQQSSLRCLRRPPPADQPATLSGAEGSWTLRPGEKLRGFTDVLQPDVGVASAEVLARANALVANSTCKDRGSCDTESEIRHTGENDLWMFLLPIPIAFFLALLLPRFSAYVLGPAVLIGALGLAIVERKLFVPFQSDGSPAGMLVPAIAWLVLIVCCAVGVALIATGLARIKARKRARAATAA